MFRPFTSAIWTFHLSRLDLSPQPDASLLPSLSCRFLEVPCCCLEIYYECFPGLLFPRVSIHLHQLTWRFQIFIWKPSLHHSVTNQSSFSGLVSCRHFSPNAIQVAFEFFVLISWFSWKSPQDSGALVWLLTSSNLGLFSLLLQSG